MMYTPGLTFLWKKQRECNLSKISKLEKEKCNYMERQNMDIKMFQKRLLTTY
jgi:hypothetical protein